MLSTIAWSIRKTFYKCKIFKEFRYKYINVIFHCDTNLYIKVNVCVMCPNPSATNGQIWTKLGAILFHN